MNLQKSLIIVLILTFPFCWVQSKSYKLVWKDDFSGKQIDTTKWSYNIWPAFKANKEEQAYTDFRENVQVKNGKLVITALKKQYGNAAYTSGRIVTKHKGDWLYGKIEVRAKLPQGVGVWPAIWMLPTGSIYGRWPQSGEIDIMEFVGFEKDTVHATIHTEAFNHKIKTDKGGATKLKETKDGFHVYGCIWTEERLDFYVDGEKYFSFENDLQGNPATWPFNRPFHLILNLAIGGSWGGMRGIDNSIFPQEFVVDWVKVYQ